MRTRFLTVGETPGISCLGSSAKVSRSHEVCDGIEANRFLKKAQRNASSRKLLNLALWPPGQIVGLLTARGTASARSFRFVRGGIDLILRDLGGNAAPGKTTDLGAAADVAAGFS